MRLVYLAGSIFNNPNPGEWRAEAITMLPEGWRAVNPLDFEVGGLKPTELVTLDYYHIQGCHAVIARVTKPTWGTAMEIGYAKRMPIPVFTWSARPIESPWLIAHSSKHFLTLQEACMELRHVVVQ